MNFSSSVSNYAMIPTAEMKIPEREAPSTQIVMVRDHPEVEAVRGFLKGVVPQRGSSVVDLVNRMVF